MQKLIIFDLDGVLVESKNLHYTVLNNALKQIDGKYVIGYQEHLGLYDGLSTTQKLKLLTEKKNLPTELYNKIWDLKQGATFEAIKNYPPDKYLIKLFSDLSKLDFKIAIASNSIRKTTKLFLCALGIMPYIDYYVSNEDVRYPKPYPEMYWKCMTALKCLPKDTVIIEDSHIGREGALQSGAILYPVKDTNCIRNNKFQEDVKLFFTTENKIPWRDKKMNVLIPMAGLGSRFAKAGYVFPKPLIEVNGKPMIQLVIENLNIEANYVFIVLQKEYEKYNLQQLLNLIVPNCTIVTVDTITEGAACTTLLAKEYINNDSPLLIANADQYIVWDSNKYMYAFNADNIDGGILTFKSIHPKWSFVEIDSNNFVLRVAEKNPISNNATVGIYYWKHGLDYIKYAEQMINKNIRVNNEFYICPVFNEAIEDGKVIVAKEVEQMWGLGTPEDLQTFLDRK